MLLSFLSCGNSESEKLSRVERYLNRQENDSGIHLLKTISYSDLDDDDSQEDALNDKSTPAAAPPLPGRPAVVVPVFLLENKKLRVPSLSAGFNARWAGCDSAQT